MNPEIITIMSPELNNYLIKKGFTIQDLFKADACIADNGKLYYGNDDPSYWLYQKSGIKDKNNTDLELTIMDIITNKLRVYGFSGCRSAIFVPIYSLLGKVIGMSIRKMHDEQKHDSWFKPGCRKIDTIYGLNTAFKDITLKQSIILTEGVYDTIALRKYGFTQACALLGTHMSNLQFFQVASITKNICLCLDNDDAGLKACNKIIDTYSKIYGDIIKFYILGLDKDPDEFLKEHSPEELKRRLRAW